MLGFMGLGTTEIVVILVIALIVLGPSKLPELAKSLGRGLREFRKASSDFRATVEDEMYAPESETKPAELPASTETAAAPKAVDAPSESAPAAPEPLATAPSADAQSPEPAKTQDPGATS